MYIREVTKKVKGQRYTQIQLIESIRTSSGPRQRMILNLGNLDIPKEQWKDLANAISDNLNNQPRLFEGNARIKVLAKQYTQMIVRKRFEKVAETGVKDRENVYEKIDVKTVNTSEAVSIGAEEIALRQMDEYKFGKILEKAGFSHKEIIYAKMLIMGRMVHASSERETARWINNNSGSKELLRTTVKVYDKALHRVAVKLWENYKQIEDELRREACRVFSIKESIILYDLTNTYFEGSKRDSKIVGFRRSKDRRNDRPLITLALRVDDDGFPKSSKILKGDITESATFAEMLDELDAEKGLFGRDKTIVIDAGIASDDNINLIKDKGFKYVVVSRKKVFKGIDWSQTDEEVLKLQDKKTRLKIRLAKMDDENYLLCHSEAKQAKERSIVERKMSKFENELRAINDKLQTKRGIKKYDKVVERIGRLKGHYKVGLFYNIKIEKKGNNAVGVGFVKNDRGRNKELSSGKYLLRTNRTDLTGSEISKIHRSLTMIEDSFRGMKGELGLRPNYHHEDDPTVAHINITVMAYHIVCGILKRLEKTGITYNWNSIRNILSTHVRVTTNMHTDDNYLLQIRTNTIPNAQQQMIYEALKIKQNLLSRVVMRTRLRNVVSKNQSQIS